MNHPILKTVMLAAALAAVAGCAAPGSTSTAVATQAAVQGQGTAAQPSGTPVPTVGTAPQVTDGVQWVAEPVWDQTSRDAALAAASKAWALYDRPDVDPARWLADLKPLMTAKAADDYMGTDPSRIPAHVTAFPGEVVTDPSNGFAAGVRFSTNAGTYTVQLLRAGAGEPFKVTRFDPPS
jgi:hypothetical protein